MIDQGVYEGGLWAVIVGVSLVFIFYAYLLLRLSRLTRSSRWRFGFRFAAACSLFFGIARLIVAVYYYENPEVRLSIPITAAVSWAFIAAVGYAAVRWIEQAAARIAITREGMALMNDIIDEAIEPLLRGEDAPHEVLTQLHQRRRDLAAAK